MSEQERKLLIEILSDIVTGLYREMGKDWCSAMLDKINEIQNAGKP